MSVKLILPWVCCVRDNRHFIPKMIGRKDRLVSSPEYREKKEQAETLFTAQWHGNEKLKGDLRLHADCYFPDLRKRDAGNYRKMIGDALSGIAYSDDSQLVSETWERKGIDRENPRIEITLEAA